MKCIVRGHTACSNLLGRKKISRFGTNRVHSETVKKKERQRRTKLLARCDGGIESHISRKDLKAMRWGKRRAGSGV